MQKSFEKCLTFIDLPCKINIRKASQSKPYVCMNRKDLILWLQ